METSAITALSSNATVQQPDRVTLIAREFEALFTSMMFKAMRNTTGDGELIPKSMGEKIYTGMLDEEYAKMAGTGGTLGLAGLIEQELRRNGAETVSTGSLQSPAWLSDTRLLGSGTGSAASSQSLKDGEGLMKRIGQWNDLIDRAAEENSVDRNLVAAIIAQESGGNRFAVSRAGAKGLMQLMDTTAQEMGVSSSFDPQQNIYGGVRYMRSLLERFDGDEKLALASYNAGPGAVEKYNGIPPYRETQNYVKSVLSLRSMFTALAADKEE